MTRVVRRLSISACGFSSFVIFFYLQLIEAGISSKIMKVALAQQKEIADEENAERNPSGAVFAAAAAKTAEEEQRILEEDEKDDDIDAFDGNFEEDDSYHQVSESTLFTLLFFFLMKV